MATITATATPTTRTLDRTIRLRRRAGAIALPLAFVLQLGCNAIYATISSESGLTDTGAPAEALELYGRYPGPFAAATLLAMVGVLVMIPGLLAALRVLRPSRPGLALWAVVLMIAGYVCYLGVVTTNFDTLGLVEFGAANPEVDIVAAFVAGQSPLLIPFFLLFVIGNLIGTLLLGLAVLRSRDLPWWAGVLIMAWPVGHIINIVGAGEWFAVAGGALEIVGLSIVAAGALRTSDADWAARG